MREKKYKISVIVCTFNREDVLENCLASLQTQITQNPYEIIIIDNNSTPLTKDIADKFVKKKKNFSYYVEKQQGLSYCRNRGALEAKGDYVAYIDDDAYAEKNWLSIAENIIGTYNPDIFGGPIYPYYLSSKPAWFKDEYEIRIHKDKSGWMHSGENISGSNIFIKKNVLDSLGRFDTSLGMKGTKLAYGEETALLHKAYQQNYKVYYDYALMVKHLVPRYKMNLIYFLYSSLVAGKYNFLRQNDFSKPIYDNTEEIYSIISELELLLKEKFEELKMNDVMAEEYIIKELCPKLITLGFLSEKHNIAKKNKIGIIKKTIFWLKKKL